MANPFVHVELNTTDLPRAKQFFASLFDWDLAEMPMGDGMTYTAIRVGEGTGGGMMTHPMPGQPSIWIPYVLVPDVAAATEKARGLGAQVIRGKTEVPDMGWFSVILDPTGAALGMWQTKMA
ncbi:MAG TPA: VOC family protein [Acetobacteraceae bacterium]|nr:VOC family protein [Acetobacteraceae bacterium]